MPVEYAISINAKYTNKYSKQTESRVLFTDDFV